MIRCEPVWKDFAHTHFSSARLGDQRRNRRLVESLTKMLASPGGTLPERFTNRSDLVGFYRLMDCPDVTHHSILEPYLQKVQERMSVPPVVLLVHDSTELDFTSKTAIDDLGPIGNGGGRGYICHNTLAITPDKQVLGLACQILHTRRQVPKGETPKAKREAPDRESLLWLRACAKIGPAPQGHLWIDIADRGSDTFEFIDFEKAHGRSFIIRSARNRNLSGEDHVGADRIYFHLYDLVGELPIRGTKTIELEAKKGKGPKRQAVLGISSSPVTLGKPHFVRGHCSSESLELWVICVKELHVPPGVEGLCWILLTDLPSETFEQCRRWVDYYACRPIVEDYHKGKKTGCQIEELQFTDRSRLEPAIALLSIVTATLLDLRSLARDPEASSTLAGDLFPREHVAVLSRWRFGESRDLSVLEFAMALARLGGHQGMKGNGFPGWQTMFKGWKALTFMVQGAYPAGP